MAKKALKSSQATDELGPLPVWDLSDLYPGMDAPEVQSDLQRGAVMSEAFEARYKGNLKALAEADGGGRALAEAVAEYERIEEILGRLGSFAGLVYSSDTSDPVRAKFFGDLQDRLTTISTHLLFFPLELNRLDDAVSRQRSRRRLSPTTGHGSTIFVWSGRINSRTGSKSSFTKNP